MKKTIGFIGMLFVFGCKVEIEAPLKLSEAQSGKDFEAVVNIEVPGCHSYEDSRKPSETLEKVIAQAKEAFPDATYKECFKKKMESFASFEVKGKYLDLPEVKENSNIADIQILKASWEMNGVQDFAYAFAVSPEFKKKVNTLAKQYFSTIKPLIYIEVTNDSGEEKIYSFDDVYVDDYPVADNNELDVNAGATYTIRLPDVKADNVFWGDTYNWTFFLEVLNSEKNKKEVKK